MTAARVYYRVCLMLGRLLRSAKYSSARVVSADGERHVRKSRAFYAPPLIWISGLLVRLLDIGVRFLPQPEWESQERRLYWSVYGMSVRADVDGTLLLPFLPGRTLAALLEDPALDESVKRRAIVHAVAALAAFHRRGFTHGDAMAENVLVDLDAGVARWFDFETAHDQSRPMVWRHADDLRALLTTCLIRATPEARAALAVHVLDTYHDNEVTRLVAAIFSSVMRRSLAFHLAQAPLTFDSFREIAQVMQDCST